MAGNLYKNLKAEYPIMYAVVKDFSEDIRESAFLELVRAFEKSENGQTRNDTEKIVDEADGLLLAGKPDQNRIRGIGKDMEWYADNCDLLSINDMEFAAFVAFYYCEASEIERKDSVDTDDLERACDMVGRDIPGGLGDTLYNAKRKRRYLDSKAKGKYTLGHKGRHFVKNSLLNSRS